MLEFYHSNFQKVVLLQIACFVQKFEFRSFLFDLYQLLLKFK